MYGRHAGVLTVPGVTRVVVYTGGDGIDLTLPGDVPVAVLLPALHDLLSEVGLHPSRGGALAPIGHGPLDSSKTLQQNGVRDGSVLMLRTAGVAQRAPAVIDPAVAVAAAAGQSHPAGPLAIRRAGMVVATVMAALTGVLVVPGGPGLPDVLLASAAAAVTAVVSVRVVGDPAGAGSATAWVAALCSVVALVGTLGGLSVATSGVALVVVSLAVLTCAARLVVRVSAGAEPAVLHRRLAALTAGAAAGAALGVVAVACAQPGWAACVLGAVVAAVLALRIRAHRQALSAFALGGGGMVCAAAALLRLGVQVPLVSCLLAVVLGVAGLLLAVSFGRIPVSPVTDRVLNGLELGLLAAVTPWGCWTVGAFGGLLP